MSASYNKLNCFVQDLAHKVHNLGTDTLVWVLSNTAPNASITTTGGFTEISYTNLSSRTASVVTSIQSGGTYKLVVSNTTLAATGNVAAFRYIGLANYTSAASSMICWHDRGASLTMVSGDSFGITSDQTNGILTLA